ncbi:sugar-binding transcriptional regulator [Paenibacillus doosanensis]|uniref:Deoxyribonucleoside regulator n=1 Tax=Paenibacillus konkukensis TaxID=2020716 RepID=A0ABY4RKL6_9BACL|nr:MULTISPECIES: sugar-binding transcriptional regulator [Paenibacillus]MCS7462931.1 sugar-binding transcriptional regulator [Paenibacillus doosanensis]UQZ82375.1 Deoxyribonucleoside regulator [Paenibacillus konkukensis]
MEDDKLRKVIEVAKLYYQLDYNQNQIAEMLGLSRPTVSRLLQQAKAEGVVKIHIVDPAEDCETLANDLRETFQLKKAVVAFVPTYDDDVVKKFIGEAAADYLVNTVKDKDIIGASWGLTMYHVATNLQHKNLNDSRVVQLNGGVSHADIAVSPSEIIYLFSRAFHVSPYFLYLPAIVDHPLVRQAITSDRHIRRVLDLGKLANIAIFSVGLTNSDSVLIQSNYFTDEDLEIIKEKAVGDICSRYFDEDGNICNTGLDDRTIGIELADLKQKEQSILVAGGAKKVKAIYGALRGQYANVLITDQNTAKALLARHEENRP